ncbi:MAG: type II CAAX endopeptidase family protein [Candidatus Thorarchaeota archaeon]
MTKAEVVSTDTPTSEEASRSFWTHVPLIALGGLFLFLGVVWRNVDVFILGLSESWLNILPCKLFPLLIILGFFWLYRRSEMGTVLGLTIHEPRKHVSIGIIVGVALFLMGNVIASVIYWAFIDSSLGLNVTIIRVDLLWYSAIFFLINAVYEEVLFRGTLQNGLRAYMSVNRAILTSAVVFGVYHLIWPIYFAGTGTLSLSHIFVYVVFSAVLGGIFGIYYEKFSSRRTLLGPIIAHWLINFLNENIKVSSSEVIAGPDVLLGNPPIQMAIALGLVLILYATSIFLFSKYRVEDLDGWFQRRRAQFRYRSQEEL